MPSRRDEIRMSPSEIQRYLEMQRRLVVVTIGPGGMPHPVPMNFGLYADGRIVITAFGKSQKIVNLERDPRASLLAESGDTYHELKSVLIYANAEIVRDRDRIREEMKIIRSSDKLDIPQGSPMRDQVTASIDKRAVVIFTPYKFISWDHGKLIDKY